MALSHFLKRILSGKTLILVLVVAAFSFGLLVRGGKGNGYQETAHLEADQQEATIWTCSMHPQIQLPKPGKCPICFMDLIPLSDSGEEEPGPRTLVLSEAAAALAEIQTVPVERRPATAEIRLIGKVDYDETRYRTIAARVPGRIDTLFVDYTGTTIRRGERLVSLYSPELFAAQAELLNALQAAAELQASNNQIIRQTAEATVAAARERLRLWGLTEQQVAGIEQRGSPSYHMAIRSPLSGVVIHKNAVEGMYVQTGTHIYTVADLSQVWVTLAAYESDLAWLQQGQTVHFKVAALPGRAFSGAIMFIDPVLDEKTRTAMVRLDVDNDDGLLKPGMFVDAVARAGLSASAQPVSGERIGEGPLVIPASAPLITGKRAVVYVRLPDRQKPTFAGREVVLGPRAGDFYVVDSGLLEGELVVVKGNFKIDSALQIQAKPSMMNPIGGGSDPGHGHDTPAAPDDSPSGEAASAKDHPGRDPDGAMTPMTHFSSPASFVVQLGGLLAAYLEIQSALAADNVQAAVQTASAFAAALQSVDMGLLTGDAHAAWMKDLDRLKAALSSYQAADDITAQRDEFLPLSRTMWKALRRFGYQGHQVVRLFHCPMASGGAGADWLQIDRTTANPYYGAAMLRCGSQTDSIPAATRTEGKY
jgi:Cu(I)/Ag(I) efflux system membrane fusion protein